MGLGDILGGIVSGGAAGSALGPWGTAGGAVLGGLSGIFGGGGGSDDGGGGGQPGDAYANFAAQMAAQNNPLTAAYQGLSLMQGALAGAIGLEGTTKASAQLGILKEALQRAQKDATLQASTAGYSAGKGIDTLYNLGQGRLSTELLAPQFLQQAGSAALAGQNQLANQLGTTNMGIRAYQEQILGDIANKQAQTMDSVFQTRAKNEGALALGAPQTMDSVFQTRAKNEGALALGAQAAESAMNLDKVRTLGDLARTKAATKGQLALKKFGANQALAGTRMFA
jgi:hypothetical protein